MALLVVHFFENRKRTGPAVMSADGKENVQEADRSRVRVAEWSFHRSQKAFMSEACDRRYEGVGDPDTIGAIGVGLLQAFHSLAQSAPETDCNHKIFLAQSTDRVQSLSRRDGNRNGKAEQSQFVIEKIDQTDRHIAANQEDSARLVDSLGKFYYAIEVERIAQGVEILEILIERLADMRGQPGIYGPMARIPSREVAPAIESSWM